MKVNQVRWCNSRVSYAYSFSFFKTIDLCYDADISLEVCEISKKLYVQFDSSLKNNYGWFFKKYSFFFEYAFKSVMSNEVTSKCFGQFLEFIGQDIWMASVCQILAYAFNAYFSLTSDKINLTLRSFTFIIFTYLRMRLKRTNKLRTTYTRCSYFPPQNYSKGLNNKQLFLGWNSLALYIQG